MNSARSTTPGTGSDRITPSTTNRTNSSGGQTAPTPNQQGGILAITIPAGGTRPSSIPGCFFYVIAASGPVEIRPSGGDFNTFQPGTGYQLPNGPAGIPYSFQLLELFNPNTESPVSVAVFVGFGTFIDNRLILESGVVQPVMKVTYSGVPAVPGPILIEDISGQAFSDQNGIQWLAIQRICFYVDNLNTAGNLIVQNAASDGQNCGTVFPATVRTFPVSGDFTLDEGGGNVSACVTEIYNAVLPNIPL